MRLRVASPWPVTGSFLCFIRTLHLRPIDTVQTRLETQSAWIRRILSYFEAPRIFSFARSWLGRDTLLLLHSRVAKNRTTAWAGLCLCLYRDAWGRQNLREGDATIHAAGAVYITHAHSTLHAEGPNYTIANGLGTGFKEALFLFAYDFIPTVVG